MRHFLRFMAQGKLGLFLGFVASILVLTLLAIPAFAASTVNNSQPLKGSWKVVPSPGGGDLHGVAVVSANDVWAVGTSGNGSASRVEHWNGTSWSLVSAPGTWLTGVAVVSASDIWAVGWKFFPKTNAEEALIDHWNGSAWSIVASPKLNSNSYLNSVTVVSASDVWAVGYTGTQQNNQPLIEQWNGTSWSVVTSPGPGQLNGVAAVSANDVWAVGTNFNKSLIEHWDGTSWTIVSSPGSLNGLNGLSVISASDIWAVGSQAGKTKNKTLTEHWDGTSWTIVPSPNVPGGPEGNGLDAVSAISSNNVWAVGEYSTGGNLTNNTLVEHWNGSAWKVVASPSPESYNTLYAVAFVPGSNHLWAVGGDDYTGGPNDSTLTEYYV